MISRAEPIPNKSNSEYAKKERIYRTPNLPLNNKSGEKIMVTFIRALIIIFTIN